MTTTKLVTELAQGLGALCWWDLGDTAIAPAALRTILADEGVVLDVPDPEAGSAVKRAAREWRVGNTAGKGDRYRTEVVAEVGDQITVGLLRREQVSGAEVRWVQDESIAFYASASTWSGTPTTDGLASFVRLAEAYRTTLDHHWIRPKLIQASLDAMAAFTLRRQGGVSYVPSAHLTDLERLARVVGKIGSSALHIAHVQATDASRRSIGLAARESLAASVDDVRARLDAWRESARKVRADSSDNMLVELRDLKMRAELYQDALEVQLDDLVASMSAATDEVTSMLSELPTVASTTGTTVDALVAALRGWATGQADPAGWVHVPSADVAGAVAAVGAIKFPSFWAPSKRGGLAATAAGVAIRQLREQVDGSRYGVLHELLVRTLDMGAVDHAGEVLPPEPDGAIIDDDVEEEDDSDTAVDAEEEDEQVELDREERVADLRERLAGETVAKLRTLLEQTTGSAAPKTATKPYLVEQLVTALS